MIRMVRWGSTTTMRICKCDTHRAHPHWPAAALVTLPLNTSTSTCEELQCLKLSEWNQKMSTLSCVVISPPSRPIARSSSLLERETVDGRKQDSVFRVSYSRALRAHVLDDFHHNDGVAVTVSPLFRPSIALHHASYTPFKYGSRQGQDNTH